MKEYKRLITNNLEEYDPEYDFCIECKYFGEPNGCNRPNGTCDNYDRFIEMYTRLTELEDQGKTQEDNVALSKEEFSKALTDNFNMGKKEAQFYSERVVIPTTRKETAEKFLQLAYDRCLEKSFIKKVEELAKQFGVKIQGC